MKILTILLLVITFSISISRFLEIFNISNIIPIDIFILGILITLMGLGFGVFSYFLSNYPKRGFVILIIVGSIFLILFLTYAIFGFQLFATLFVNVVIFGFLFLMSTIPMIGIYSIFKKQKKALYASGFGIIFFFIFHRFFEWFAERPIGMIDTEIITNIMFFIMFITYLELGSRAINFNMITYKMTPNENPDESLLQRYNHFINRYIIIMASVLLTSFFISAILIINSAMIALDDFIGLDFSSVNGILFLVMISLICAVVFWYVIPREKIENT